MSEYDIARIIKEAKLGGARKDAQIDACEPFAAALFDALNAAGIETKVFCATFFIVGSPSPEWAHAIVQVGGVFYDSLGVFNHEVVRARLRIHKNVQTRLQIEPDVRDFDARDWSEMHAFCLKKIEKSVKDHVSGKHLELTT